MTRIRLELDRAEYRGLVRLAEQELRPVSDQARFMVREALKRAGLLGSAGADASELPRIREEAASAAR